MQNVSNLYRAANNPLAISPGELKHKVQILAPGAAGDTFGQSVTPASWTEVREAPAAIYTVVGKETSQASQLISAVSHVVKVRWSPVTIKANYRVQQSLWRTGGTKTYIVQWVENVLERDRVLLLYCLEVDGGGQ